MCGWGSSVAGPHFVVAPQSVMNSCGLLRISGACGYLQTSGQILMDLWIAGLKGQEIPL